MPIPSPCPATPRRTPGSSCRTSNFPTGRPRRGGREGPFGSEPQMTSTTEDLAKLDLIRAMEDLAAPACVIGKDGRFSWLNQAYLDLIGDTRGRPFLENVAPEHKQLSRTNFARKMVGKTTTVFDMTVLDRAGERL